MGISVKSRRWQGYSTVNSPGMKTLYDSDLVKQDLLNIFYTRKGEDITDPTKGSIIWDMLFEPNTQENINKITQDCLSVFATEPRIKVKNIKVSEITSSTGDLTGYIMQAELSYLDIPADDEVITLKFNKTMISSEI